MRVINLKTENYRNLPALDYSPCAGVNLICGENGKGKTNLIESIWLFTGCRSFRSVKDADVVNFGAEKAEIRLAFFAKNREQKAEITVDSRRSASLNGVPLKSGRRMMGEFTAVVFTPLHLGIVKDGPEERRKFLDIAISQLKPNYAKTIIEYNRALLQRNTMLKAQNRSASAVQLLEIWEEELAKKGAAIIEERMKYLERLTVKACEIYDEISSGKEILELKYSEYSREKASGVGEIRDSLLAAYKEKRENDFDRRFTSVGPHREGFSIKLSGNSARLFGSQGQQRSAALALKLAEARLITSVTGEEPVVLLDDVFSELDPVRQKYLLGHFENRQVFITCCDEDAVKRLGRELDGHGIFNFV